MFIEIIKQGSIFGLCVRIKTILHYYVEIFCIFRRTPVKGILKSRPVTPDNNNESITLGDSETKQIF